MVKATKAVAHHGTSARGSQPETGGITWNAVSQTEEDNDIYNKKIEQLAPYCAAMRIRIADCRKEGDQDKADKMETILTILEKRRYVGIDYLKSLENWILSKKEYLMKASNNQTTNSSAGVGQDAMNSGDIRKLYMGASERNMQATHGGLITKPFSTIQPTQQVSGDMSGSDPEIVVPISAPREISGHTERAEMNQNKTAKWERAMDGISLVNYPGSTYKKSSNCDEQDEIDEIEELKRMRAERTPRINYDNPKINYNKSSKYQARVRVWQERFIHNDEYAFIEDRDEKLTNPGDTDRSLKIEPTSFEKSQSLEKNVAEWSSNEVSIFEESMFQCKNNFAEVQKSLPNKTVGECVKFYYSWKKTSPDAYGKLKKSLKDQRELEEKDHNWAETNVAVEIDGVEEKCANYVNMTKVQNKVKSLENFYTSFNKLTHAVEDVAVSHSQLTAFYKATENTHKSEQEKEKRDCMLATLGDALEQIDAVVTKTSKKLEMFPDPRKTTKKIQKIMKNIKDYIKEAGYMDDIVNYVSQEDNSNDSDYFDDTLLENFPHLGEVSAKDKFANAEETPSQTITVFHPKIQYHDIEVETDQSAKNRDFSGSLDFYTEYRVEVPAGCHTGLVFFPIENKYTYTHIIDEVIEGSPLARSVDVDTILKKELITVNGQFVKNINALQVVQIIRDFCVLGGTLLLGVLHETVSNRDRNISQENEFLRKELKKTTEERNQLKAKIEFVQEVIQKHDEEITEERKRRKENGNLDKNIEVAPTIGEEQFQVNQHQKHKVEEEEIDSEDSITGSEDSSSSDSDSSDSDFEHEAIEAKMVENDATSQNSETVEGEESPDKTSDHTLEEKLAENLENRQISNESVLKKEETKVSAEDLSSDDSTTDSDSDESRGADDSDDLESDESTTENEDSDDESDSTSSDEESTDSDSDSSHLNDAENKPLEDFMAALRRRQQDGIKEDNDDSVVEMEKKDDKIQLEKLETEACTVTKASEPTEPVVEKDAHVVPTVKSSAETMLFKEDKEIAKNVTDVVKNTEKNGRKGVWLYLG